MFKSFVVAVLTGISAASSEKIMCMGCNAVVTATSDFIQMKNVSDWMINTGVFVCETFNLANPPKEICPGMVKLMGDVIISVLTENVLTRNRICD